MDGVTVRWSHDIGDEVTGAVIQDDVVYTASDPSEARVGGGVYAFDLASGEELWRYPEFVSHIPPVVVSQGAVFAVSGHSLVALEGDTGEERWRQQWEGHMESAPAVGDDHVYVGNTSPHTSHSDPAYPEDLFALSVETGEIVWKQELQDEDSSQTKVAGWRPPVLLEDTGRLVVPTTTGGAVVLDAQDGSRLDTIPHDPERKNSIGMFQEAGLVFGVFGEQLYAYDPASLTEEWRASDVSVSPDGGGGQIAAGTRDRLTVFDAQTGARLWSKPIDGDTGLWSPYSATESGIYANSINGDRSTLFKFDPNGETLWELTLNTDGFSRVVENDGIAVVGTGSIYTSDDGADGSILALEASE